MSNLPSLLLSLPNCLILQLLSYLDATSLYFLSNTCTRFSDFIKSHSSLWKRIDARRYPNNEKKRLYCLRRGHRETHTLLLREDKEPAGSQPPVLEKSFFSNLQKFSNLKVLAIENQTINGNQYKISSFPVYLEEFSLKRSTVLFSDNFFRHSSESMKNLRVLILDECNWLAAGDFMPISKYKKLEILSVYKCSGLNNSIAYLSLSGYGFKQLRVLDVRLSPLGNTLLRSIYKCPSLLAIYYQNDDTSYKLDYYKRKLEIAAGGSCRDFYSEDAEIDAESGVEYRQPPALTDCGLIDYSQVANLKHELKHPESVLYLDPYNPCTCGYKGKGKKLVKPREKISDNSSSSDDSDDDDAPDDRSLRKLKTLVKNSKKTVKRRSLRFARSRNYCDPPSSPPHVVESTVVINLRRSMARVIHEPHQNVCVLNVFGPSNENPRPNVHVLHLNDEAPPQNIELNEHINNVIDVLVNRCRKRPHDDSPASSEPKAKKAMLDEDPVPGPSGCVNNPAEPASDESGISDGEEPEPYAERPPTPHPDIVVKIGDGHEANYDRFINVSPLVIEPYPPYQSKKQINLPLRRLSLRGYRTITNRSLNYINHLGLEVLDLTYTDVTEDAINVYLIDNPSCRVIHEKFCVCSPNLHF